MSSTKTEQLVAELTNFVQSNEDLFNISDLNDFEKIIVTENPYDKLRSFFDEHMEKLNKDEQLIVEDVFERYSSDETDNQ